jgi:hypothetical protein
MNAIKEQNLQAPAGRVGMRPSPRDQEFTYTVSAPGRLVTEDEFANIIIRESETGGQVRIKDVGRVELGSQDYNAFGRLDGKPAGAMAVYLLPGADQLKASEGLYEAMHTAKLFFPSDVDYKIVYDTTPAVEASIESIVHTFIEAVIAPSIEEDARAVLAAKQNMRVVTTDFGKAYEPFMGRDPQELRSFLGGMLSQQPDRVAEARDPWRASPTIGSAMRASRPEGGAKKFDAIRSRASWPGTGSSPRRRRRRSR